MENENDENVRVNGKFKWYRSKCLNQQKRGLPLICLQSLISFVREGWAITAYWLIAQPLIL